MGFLARASTAAERAESLREDTARALEGRPPNVTAFQALARVAAETGMPSALPFAHLDGFVMDAEDRRYRTLDDTLEYSWHVAGVVGVMMALAMGVAPGDRATLERASDLGLAFQLANIARDVVEDAARGRCYLPDEWLAEADIPPGEVARPLYRERLARVGTRLADEAARYQESARHGAAALPLRSAWAVLAAAEIYGAIGDKVKAAGARAWHRRIGTSRSEKLVLLATAGAAAARRLRSAPPPPRVGLWTMP